MHISPFLSCRYVIYVEAGVYDEQVTITKDMKNITMYGDGSEKTTVTGSKNFNVGVPTSLIATFGEYLNSHFLCKKLTFIKATTYNLLQLLWEMGSCASAWGSETRLGQ